MRMAKIALLIFSVNILSGCAATQEITHFSNKPRSICIAKHDAVREGMLTALQEGFSKHGLTTKVIAGTYVKQHNMWNANVSSNEATGCDAIAFYVANWHWDMAMYMRFANIWIQDYPNMTRLAQATYTAGAGFDKFISANEKVLELVDSMFGVASVKKINTEVLHDR